MSNKLTNEKLKELVREVLQEKKKTPKTDYPFDEDTAITDMLGGDTSWAVNKGQATLDMRALAAADPSGYADKIEKIDLDDAAASGNKREPRAVKAVADHGTSKKIKDPAKDALKAVSTSSKKTAKKSTAKKSPKKSKKKKGKIIDPTKVGNIEDIDMTKQIYEPDSIAFGQMANIGAQASDPRKKKPLGKFPEGLAASINTFFKGKSTFEERVQALSDFSEEVVSGKKITFTKSVTEMLAASLFLDYLSTIVKEIDSGAGAYQFEVLLAAMAGGAVVGKGDVSTSGAKASGQMGAVDFIMNDGSYGSSKYYSKVSSGVITQAVSGFKNKTNKTTLYIIAHKKDDATIKPSSGTADPTKITQLNIYLVSVMTTTNTPTKGSHFKVWVNGAKSASDGVLTSGGSLNLSAGIAGNDPIVIKIAASSGKALKDSLAQAAKKSSTDIENAYDQFQQVFSELYTANQKIQRYSATGNRTVGNDALDALENSDDRFINLAAEISGKKVADIKNKRKLQENKSLKDLDKLIERVILESMNKK